LEKVIVTCLKFLFGCLNDLLYVKWLSTSFLQNVLAEFIGAAEPVRPLFAVYALLLHVTLPEKLQYPDKKYIQAISPGQYSPQTGCKQELSVDFEKWPLYGNKGVN
jgi:hypothetical protein